MKNVNSVMQELIAYEVFGRDVGTDLSLFSSDFYSELYSLSAKHDLAHLVGSALETLGAELPEEVKEKFKKKVFLAVYRYNQIVFEYKRICSVLDKAEIRFVPLKGSVIRGLYPKKWHRTSCDVDILVDEDRLEDAVKLLTDSLGYTTDGERAYHDVSLYSKGGVHLELHFSIKEKMESIDRLLSRVWEYSSPKEEGGFLYMQSREYLIFHILAHTAYHFVEGGCGIRPFIDIWLLENKLEYDRDVLIRMCEECGIEKFRLAALKICRTWFLGEEPDQLSQDMEDFILGGGVYGSLENSVTVKQNEKGGKKGYLIHRIFMPYGSLKILYPVLEKHKWLLPVCWVRRWFRGIFGGRLKASVNELRTVKDIDGERAEKTAAMLKGLGL